MVSICSSTHPPTDHHFWGVQCAVCVQTNSTNATATPHCIVATACTAGASYASLLQQLETPRHDDAIQLLQQAHRLDNDDVGIQTSLGDAHVRAAAELVGTCTAASLLRNRDPPPPFSLSGQLFICSRRFPDSRFSPPLTYCQPTQSHCQIHFHTTYYCYCYPYPRRGAGTDPSKAADHLAEGADHFAVVWGEDNVTSEAIRKDVEMLRAEAEKIL